jgi:hypothetical protein
MPDDHDERDGLDERGEFGDDDADEYDDQDEPGPAGGGWPEPRGAYPPGTERPPGGSARRHGLLLALTAVVAAAAGFGVVAVAARDVTGSPAAASSSPSASEPTAVPPLSPVPGALPAMPSGATLRLAVGGQVTAVSPTSITIGADGSAVTAAVTRATKVTGKVAGIGGVKVGDLVSATITGSGGKLTADSIQDPASLPSAPGQ